METSRMLWTKNWRFSLSEDDSAVRNSYDDSAWEIVTLPHDWQISQLRTVDASGGAAQGYFPREHQGIYRLHFTAPDGWRGKLVHVLFDGVQRFSTVYLNGKAVGGRPYGYVPFMCDLTDALKLGEENILAVKVDNQDDGTLRLAGGDRWYSGAGIYRNVWLLVNETTHIAHDGIRIVSMPVLRGPSGDVPDVAGIRCDEASLSITAEVEGTCDGMDIHVAVMNPQGECICEAYQPAAAISTFDLSIPRPQLWSPETPGLYRAIVTLGQQAPHEVVFGVRSAVFDTEEGFLLNGKKTKLWGVNIHHDGGAVGAAVPIEIWKRRFTQFKALGVNTIRASHNPMAAEVYDLCDEMGFMVIDELYDKWCASDMYYDKFYDEWHLRDAEAMVRRDANHPSIILWSVGNELGNQYSELFFRCLEALCAHVRKLDPTRALTAALVGFILADYNDMTPLSKKLAAAKRYGEIVDVFSGNYMEHYYEKLREYGMRNPIIGSEVHMLYRRDEKAFNGVQMSPESPYAIARKHDWVCGSIIWAGIDYLGEATGWPQRGWTGNPLDSTGDWKLRAWYCASQWKNEPMLKLCVYDETEPWDGARGWWSFPQMRSHWKYTHFEKMVHVAAMTNCDEVRLYQNSQTVRIGHLTNFPDGMIHFHLPYIPGILRAEGYRGGLLVCEDVLHSDHEAVELQIRYDRTEIPADGISVAMVDIILDDKHGRRYALENRKVKVRAVGAPVRILLDNGDAFSTEPFEKMESTTYNGHLLVIVQAKDAPGEVTLHISVEGFSARKQKLKLRAEGVNSHGYSEAKRHSQFADSLH